MFLGFITSFSPIDTAICLSFLVAILLMSYYFSRRQKGTESYFLGDRQFPGWAIGLSMMGTSISSVTFLALPAAAFALDWRQLVVDWALLPVVIIAAIFFIPIFRQGRATTAFEYLGKRYGPIARLYGAVTFIIMQLLRTGVILYLISLPLGFLLGIHPLFLIVGFGLFVAFYATAGGIEAVIWTDVMQSLIFWGGGILVVVVIVLNLPGGLGQVIEVGYQDGKFALGSMEWDIGRRTFWTVLILGLFNWLRGYTADQTVIQRYIAASSTREARKATIICAVTSIPAWTFFFFIGTCLYVFYSANPDPAINKMEADEIFPYFISTKLPVGTAGIVLASLLAAAMSSLDSSINSICTVGIVDVLRPYVFKQRSDKSYLLMARILATFASAIMIFMAIGFYLMPKESVVDLQLIIKSLFTGAVAGFFLLGIFTTRTDYMPSLIALVAAVIFNIYLLLNAFDLLPTQMEMEVHSYWVGMLVNGLFMILAYVFSRIKRSGPAGAKVKKLTIWTMNNGNSN